MTSSEAMVITGSSVGMGRTGARRVPADGHDLVRLYDSDGLFPVGPGDVYRPYPSADYVTAHDGFCLYVVSYNDKHNEANGHQNEESKTWKRVIDTGRQNFVEEPVRFLQCTVYSRTAFSSRVGKHLILW